MPTRAEVYAAIDSEHDYSVRKWGPNQTNHEIASWITYMQNYLDDAKRIASTNAPETPALDSIRKVANLAVACMEQHGAPRR